MYMDILVLSPIHMCNDSIIGLMVDVNVLSVVFITQEAKRNINTYFV